jgi:hypothetical protein
MPMQRAWRQSNPASRWVPFYRASEVFLGRTGEDDWLIGVPGARLKGLRGAEMSKRIGGLNGAARAEKHDCGDEQVFHDDLVVVVDEIFDAMWHRLHCGAGGYRADFARVTVETDSGYVKNSQLSAWTGTLKT